MFERLWLKEELENKYIPVFIFGVVFTIISLLLTNFILPIKKWFNGCFYCFFSNCISFGCVFKS